MRTRRVPVESLLGIYCYVFYPHRAFTVKRGPFFITRLAWWESGSVAAAEWTESTGKL